MRVGIVSSQRLPPDARNWIRYHVHVGVTHFYIKFEDTPTEFISELQAYAASLGATLYTETRNVDRKHEDNYQDLMTRQAEWVNAALARARADKVDWVFHIDDDEILYPGDAKRDAISSWPQVLASVPPSCASIHLQNYEAFSPVTPTGSWLTDAGVRFLPQSCAHLYSAYANGKSGSRTGPKQKSHGPHHFTGGKECELPEDKGIVAHFEALAMGPEDLPAARWIQKNKLRLNDDMSRIPFPSVHEAVSALKTEDPAAAYDAWAKYRSVSGSQFLSCPTKLQITLPSHAWTS